MRKYIAILLVLLFALSRCSENNDNAPRRIYDGNIIGDMQYTAATYAKELLSAKLDQPYTIDITSTAVRATFDGIFLVTFDYIVENESLQQYSYKIQVDEQNQCLLLGEGEDMNINDLVDE